MPILADLAVPEQRFTDDQPEDRVPPRKKSISPAFFRSFPVRSRVSGQEFTGVKRGLCLDRKSPQGFPFHRKASETR